MAEWPFRHESLHDDLTAARPIFLNHLKAVLFFYLRENGLIK
jgi:hypothetical protein